MVENLDLEGLRNEYDATSEEIDAELTLEENLSRLMRGRK